jgi:hypothetical protein
MAQQIPISDPKASMTPSQPTNPAPPNVDYYEKIVERSHKEIEWVNSAYKWLGGFIVALGIGIIGAVAYLSFNTVHDLKKDLKEEIKEAKEKALEEVKSHIAKQKEEVTEGKAKALQEVQLHINKQIAEQFSAPNIKSTLETVAATEAKGIIEKQIDPIIKETKSTAVTLEEKLRREVGGIRAEYHAQLEDLRKEVDFQKKLSEIQRLQNRAIAQCDLEAYKVLNNYEEEPTDIKLASIASVLAIKSYFLSGSLYITQMLNKSSIPDIPKGSYFVPHGNTIQAMIPHGVFKIMRYKLDDCSAIEFLMKVISYNESLCERQAALNAFASITGYNPADVFEFDQARLWYKDNFDTLSKRFWALIMVSATLAP